MLNLVSVHQGHGEAAYITQQKQQKSKRCYYFCSTSP